MSRKMKDSGVEWIGEIPSDWKILRLKNVLKERNEKNSPIKTNEILSLTIEKGVIPYKEKKSGGNKAKEDLSNYKLAYPNDIVLNSMNVIVGAVGISKYYGCVSPVYYVLYSDDIEQNIRFYNYLFQSSAFQKSLIGLGNGIMMKQSSTGKLNTIRLRIPLDRLKNVYLPVPPVSVQQKIVNFLDEKVSHIDTIIEKNKQSIEELKKYKQSLITETVTKGLNPDVEMKDTGINWLGNIPIHWKVSKIRNIFEIKKDIANKLGYNVLSVTQQGLKIKDIESNEGQLSSDYSKYQIVEINDFVMNHMDLLTGWVDCSKYVGVTSPDYRVFRFKNNINYNHDYFKYLLQVCYLNRIFYAYGHGVSNLGRWRLPTDEFLNFYVPVPNVDEQDKIADFLNKKLEIIDRLVRKKEEMVKEMEKYKKSLIYEYVTGKKEEVM